MSKAIYPGSFDPVTYGHLDIIKRSSSMFDEVVVGVLNNSAKNPLFNTDERVQMLKQAAAEFDNVVVISFDGLLIDFMKKNNISVIVRGLRAITDFDYELQIAQSNRKVSKETIDTVFLTTSIDYAYLSSSIVREYASYGTDVSDFVPEFVARRLRNRFIH
ncbi:MAG: pantetheine-phosphate adenylyltransferase [Bacteroidales bacterium]|nr:pantetheine-phosphate adenylyltransferase [Clostridium sp.]MCM1203134.1 pantetheine-phosphate adenylyltransferase [Bacteroidales bacterium]